MNGYRCFNSCDLVLKSLGLRGLKGEIFPRQSFVGETTSMRETVGSHYESPDPHVMKVEVNV